jgi:signal transduction histidine kinase
VGWGVFALGAALASTLEEVDRLTLLSDALSLLARVVSGDLVPTVVETDVRAIAEQAVDRARGRAGEQEIRFSRPDEALSPADRGPGA